MASVFTEHVRNFNKNDDPTAALRELERLLRRRLNAPPRYFGYPNVRSWSEPDALKDVVIDCYVYSIFTRIARLQRKATKLNSIDGLIKRNVTNFLAERRRKHDPAGYAVFRNLREMLRQLPNDSRITATRNAKEKIHNGSVIHLNTSPSQTVEEIETLQQLLTPFVSENTPPNLASVCVASQEWLWRFLEYSRQNGLKTVGISDLVAVLARDVRRRTTSIEPHDADDEYIEVVGLFRSSTTLIDEEHWRKLCQTVPERLQLLNRQQRVKERVGRVFVELVRLINEGDAEPPTQADLTERLNLPRATVSDDFRILREIITEILTENSDD